MNIDNLIHILQGSIAPCILISGVGLLITAMSTRLSRSSELIRKLCAEMETTTPAEKENLKEQIPILYRRCAYLQTAIFLAAATIFFIVLVVLMLFFTFILELTLIPVIKWCFGASLVCLVLSLLFFMIDIRATLTTLKIELKKYGISV